MGLSVNILTSGFLVTVILFFVLTGILFYSAYAKIGEVLEEGNSKENNLSQLDSALKSIRVAYILAFIAAALTLILSILYAGHETVVKPSEYIHLVIYLVTYVLLVISVIYAYIALTKIYTLKIVQRNGSDSFIWAGLLMSIFAFIGLTATGTGRLGMNIVRTSAENRINNVESNINEHLPAIRNHVENHLPAIREQVNKLQDIDNQVDATRTQVDKHLPLVRDKIDELHSDRFGSKIEENMANCSIGSGGLGNSAGSGGLSFAKI